MKSTRILTLATCVALGYAALPSANGAGTINVKPAPAGKGGTNAEPGSLPVVVSVFDVSANPTKDPFFPNTLRSPLTKNTAKTATISMSSFHLTGMSGSSDSRLAIINHRTLGMGEMMEVPLYSGGKATIRVVQFKESSVVIRVVNPAQPDLIELSLSKRAQ